MKTSKLLAALGVLASFLTIGSSIVKAQDHPMDLREMSLQQLLSLDLVEVHADDIKTFYKGEWSVGYRFLHQNMNGYLDGTDRIAPESLLISNGGPFRIVQTEMIQEMHVIEASYAATDRLTLLTGIPFIDQTTAHQRVPGPNPIVGETFDVTTSGLSDITLKAAFAIFEASSYRFILLGGLSFPTGSINERGDTPPGRDRILPYTMQLGSGTFDVEYGMAYLARKGDWSWGTELNYKYRLGRNDAGYNFGNRCGGVVYLTRRITDWFAPSILIAGRGWDPIKSRDPRLDDVATFVPVANTSLFGGDRLDFLGRLNFAIPRGLFKGNRITLEGGLPLYQKLNGPQLRADYRVGVSWQWTF